MATKKRIISTGVQAREKLIRGADYLADAVKSTLGPFGKNFFLEKGNRITNDGVSVAREIEHPKEIENRGVVALREAAIKTNDEVGDGTTSAIVLAQAILKEAVRDLGSNTTFASKTTPAQIIKDIEKERVEVTKKLVAMATPIWTEKDLIASARVSVEDEFLADLIGKTQFALGPEGVILAEETAEPFSSVEIVNGVQIDNGFGTSIVINNMEKQMLEVEDTRVILTNHTLTSLLVLKPLGEQLFKMGVKNLVIVARAFSEQAIRDAMENTKQGFAIYPMNAPYTDQAEVMRDLEAVLGAKFVDVEGGDLSSLQVSDVGFASKVQAKRYNAILTGNSDAQAKERVDKRVADLEKKLLGSVSDFEKVHISKRIAQLKNGFALLKVGATSEMERKYKKDKADDAVNAVRLAYQEGTVPGAGLAFKTISEGMKDGAILKRPLMAIYEQIMSTTPEGFEVPDWARDPVKVLRVALEKACSIAGIFATAGGATATKNDDSPMKVQTVEEDEDDE